MSLFFNNDDGVHLDRLNAEQMGKRGIFINVKPVANDNGSLQQLEHQPPSFIQFSRNNLGISPASGRESVAKTPLKKNIIFDCLKPIYNFLRAFGVFPLSRSNESSEFQFRIQSPVMIYSLAIFVIFLIYSGYSLVQRITIVQELGGRFEEAVIAYLFIVNLLPIIIVPLMWYESRKVAGILNSMMDFETIYNKTAGKSLHVDLQTKATVISLLLPLLSAGSVVLTHYVTVIKSEETKIEKTFLLQVLPYCYLDTLTYMMGAYWYLACEALSSMAMVLSEDFQKALRHIGPARYVSNYRALWLRLSKMCRDFGTATCYTFTFISLYLFFIITLSIYGLMSQISEGFGVKDIGLAITAACSVCLLFFICDTSHNASHNVRTMFQKKILMVELGWMNSDAQTEINMFLRSTEMNTASINLGGFFDVNRTLFKSLLATMVTYLVVLLQFQISIPEDPAVAVIKRNISVHES